MSRTTADLVKGVLLSDYGPKIDGTDPSLTPFIDTATLIVDDISEYADENDIAITATRLEMIERWLAAHAYATSDRPRQRKSTGGASDEYQGKTGMRLKSTYYGQMAIDLDPTGYLATLDEEVTTTKKAGLRWIGKTPSEQIPLENRD